MRFDSPITSGSSALTSLPPLPDGSCLKVQAPGLGIGLGGKLWPSAGILCRWLRDENLGGRHVLELGCGCGAVGLYAAALGAESVLLTDGGGDSLLETVAGNVGRNWRFVGDRVEVLAHSWGERDIEPLPPRLDFVLGADVTYARQSHEALCRSIRWLCDERSPRIVLAHEHRLLTPAARRALGYKAAGDTLASDSEDLGLLHFCETAAAQGLHVSTMRVCTADALGDETELDPGSGAAKATTTSTEATWAGALRTRGAPPAISLLEVAPS